MCNILWVGYLREEYMRMYIKPIHWQHNQMSLVAYSDTQKPPIATTTTISITYSSDRLLCDVERIQTLWKWPNRIFWRNFMLCVILGFFFSLKCRIYSMCERCWFANVNANANNFWRLNMPNFFRIRQSTPRLCYMV